MFEANLAYQARSWLAKATDRDPVSKQMSKQKSYCKHGSIYIPACMCAWCLWKSEEGIRSPGTGVIDISATVLAGN